jgi:type VI secretion system protein ImpA
MNRERWIAEIAESSPCGEDLEYDPEFLALAQAAQGRPEQQYGDTVIPAEEPDWPEVERLADALMNRTKDVRICILLARACANNTGLPGLAAGLQTLQALLEQYWDTVHPRILIDGDADPFVRINAIAALADRSGLVRDVRNAILIKSSIGPVAVRDAEAAFGGAAPVPTAFTGAQLIAMCADAPAATQENLAALAAAEQALACITRLCDEHFGAEHAPDLSSLSDLLSLLTKNLSLPQQANADTGGASDPQAAGIETSVPQPDGLHCGSTPRCREDAIRMLQTVCRYLELNEPTSPAPLLINRAQHLMSMNFVDIIKELAPDSMGHIELITGTRRE